MSEYGKLQQLTISQAAKVLSRSEISIRRMIAARELSSTKIGRSRRIPAEAIRELVERSTITAA